MHLQRRFLRNIARMLLAVWVSALGIGLAHACVPGQHAGSGPPTLIPRGEDVPVAHAHSHDPADPAPAGCAKVCDEPVLTSPKPDKAAGDGTTGGQVSAPSALVRPRPAANRLLQAAGHPPWPESLPRALRPHRLAL